MIQTQVRAAALPVERWLEEYCKPEGASGPCPPGTPSAREVFGACERVCVVGVTAPPERLEQARQVLLAALMELKRTAPDRWTVAAARPGGAWDRGLERMARDLLGLDQAGPGVALAALFQRTGAPGSGLEVEQKYLVLDPRPWARFQSAAADLLRGAGCAVAPQGQRLQRDVYYDTPQDAVLKAGCSLRVRAKEGGPVLTWKGPSAAGGGLFARREVELPLSAQGLAGEREQVLLSVFLSGLPGAAAESLCPTAAVENRRTTALVTDPVGDVYELAFDDVTYAPPQGGPARRERQLELECKVGPGHSLARLAAALEAGLPGLKPAEDSKYRRARQDSPLQAGGNGI